MNTNIGLSRMLDILDTSVGLSRILDILGEVINLPVVNVRDRMSVRLREFRY